MSDLVTFLRARLDEDAQVAADASGRSADWVIEAESAPYAWGADPVDETVLAGGKPIVRADWEYGGILNAMHIARHDPARVLREVEAKRRILTESEEAEFCEADAWSQALFLLAAVYSEHPDYDRRWTP